MLNIALVGATGNIGQTILSEALSRGYRVTGTTRDATKLPNLPNLKVAEVHPSATMALADVLRDHDAIVVSLKWNDNDINLIVDAIRQSGVSRAIIVVGAGSLVRDDGRLHFDHMPTPPPSSKPAMVALEIIRKIDDFDWTAISPPAVIQPGERTGRFAIDTDHMVAGRDGNCRISREDFAVAIIDELENPKFIKQRFTVGYR